MRRNATCAMVAGPALVLTTVAAATPPVLELLPSVGPDAGSSVVARGISGDGQVVAGSQVPLMWERPFIWRKADGVWTRTELPREGGFGWGRPVALSYTGDTIAGMTNQYLSGAVASGTPAIWFGVLSGAPTVISPLDEPGQPLRRGCFGGLSADGSIAAGFAQLRTPTSSPGEIWSFTGAANQVSPPGVPASFLSGLIAGNSLSADGSIIAGSATAGEYRLAFRWTQPEGFTALPTPATGQYRHSRAECISADGAVIGGHLAADGLVYNTLAKPCVWRDGARADLPLIQGISYARVLALSGNGAIAGGVAYTNILGLDSGAINSNIAAIWLHGKVHRLDTYLTGRGVSLGGMSTSWISGVSEDGLTITGVGNITATGRLQSFIITLPTACEGDLTEDGLTDFADYLLFLNYYEAQDLRADLSGDSRVDFSDYLEFLNLYGQGC